MVELERGRENLLRVLPKTSEHLLVGTGDPPRLPSPSRDGSSPIASRISETAASMRALSNATGAIRSRPGSRPRAQLRSVRSAA